MSKEIFIEYISEDTIAISYKNRSFYANEDLDIERNESEDLSENDLTEKDYEFMERELRKYIKKHK